MTKRFTVHSWMTGLNMVMDNSSPSQPSIAVSIPFFTETAAQVVADALNDEWDEFLARNNLKEKS